MDATYVKEMERLANEGRTIEAGGRTFSPLSMKPVFYQPRPEPMVVRTLTGLRDYIDRNPDRLAGADILIHVRSHGEVAVQSRNGGEDMKRDTYLVAKHDGAAFRFDAWMPSEAFIVAVNALFVPTKARDELLQFISKLKIEDETNLIDDGISQSAQARVGVKGALTENTKAPSRITLQPFRTFAEIVQPESEFVFRMRQSGSGDVELALFEADGGAWKSEAMYKIAKWIDVNFEQKGGLTILA